MIAFLSPRDSRCRSTQLTHAFSRPPTHHLKNGGLLVSSERVPLLVPGRAGPRTPSKHSGKCSGLKRSRIDSIVRVGLRLERARAAGTYSSSRQWTAICVFRVLDFLLRRSLGRVCHRILSFFVQRDVATRAQPGATGVDPPAPSGHDVRLCPRLRYYRGPCAAGVFLLYRAQRDDRQQRPGRRSSSSPPRTTRTTPRSRWRCRGSRRA